MFVAGSLSVHQEVVPEDEEEEVIKEEEVEWVLEKELQAPRPMPELLEILNVGCECHNYILACVK